ncbi:thrombomodulin-like [Mastacembelus armatus]|uniref:thrombomodulin-like n=1 Tax=Mastacembelus armatus TaxID=205130 RepID=UPI000E4613A5|nr:thrombomodulin-like [Mastacembelus armatus]
MITATRALLICALFLCELEDTVLCQRGNCAGNQCFALFQKHTDFEDAQKSCKDSEGQLLVFGSSEADKMLTLLLSGVSGTFWLGSKTRTGEVAGHLPNCPSISVTGSSVTQLSKRCRDKLDGFLCQYTFAEPCSRFQAGGDAQVTFISHLGFEVKDVEEFPPGTVAVVQKVGGEYPDSKHVCVERKWMRAPWKCEVMRGGCEHTCSSATDTCLCPAKQTLHPNNITCTKEPCADCEHECQLEGDSYVCKCIRGYRQTGDRKSCVDINECEEQAPCTGEGEECVNTQGGFKCTCKDGFEEEDEKCVDIRICKHCEHMKCEKSGGVYKCACWNGFRVSSQDPTKCELYCTERDCLANCIRNPESDDRYQCYCPKGYVEDVRNNTTFCTDINECEIEKQCDHTCENLFGGYRCLCDEGFTLQKGYMCVPDEEVGEESGSSPPYPTQAPVYPAAMPPYIKTGSVLGITVFMMLCAALLYFLVRHISRRCGKFELPSLKHPDIDIFYLQQVTTDTYKRLSFDRQF